MIGEVVGGRSKREGIYVYVWLIHFLVQQKHNIIKQLYSTKIKLKNYCKHTKKKKNKNPYGVCIQKHTTSMSV